MNIDIVLNSNKDVYVKDIAPILAAAVHSLDVKNELSDVESLSYQVSLREFEAAIKRAVYKGDLTQKCPITKLPKPNAVGAESTDRSVVSIEDLAAFVKDIGFNIIFQTKTPKVSQAPAPISPVRGSTYVSPKDTDRMPRWQKWKLIPEVKLWEAVSLSLNIEPEKVKTNGNAWMGSHHPFTEGETFNDRLEVLKQHKSNSIHFPTSCSLEVAQFH